MISLCFLSAAVVGPLALTPDAAKGQTLILLCSEMNVPTSGQNLDSRRQEPDFSKTIELHFKSKKLTIHTPTDKNSDAYFTYDAVSISWPIVSTTTTKITTTTIDRITGAISTRDGNDALLSYGGCHVGDKQF
jgi:hypothetical protein